MRHGFEEASEGAGAEGAGAAEVLELAHRERELGDSGMQVRESDAGGGSMGCCQNGAFSGPTDLGSKW